MQMRADVASDLGNQRVISSVKLGEGAAGMSKLVRHGWKG